MARARRRARRIALIAGASLLTIGAGAWWASRGPAPGKSAGTTVAVKAPAPHVVGARGAVVVTAASPTDVEPTEDAVCRGCDVVLITVCSLRRDHVGPWRDGAPSLTPRLDAVAAEAFRFDRAYAASNFTLAGLTAVLTARFGSSTGVTGWDKGLVDGIPTLPEVLGHYGYRTAAFTIDAASGFRPDYGLDRGFSHMEIIPPPRLTPDGRLGPDAADEGPGASAAPAAAWIAAQGADQPIFAMFHSRTAHFPFVVERPGDDPTGILTGLWEAGQQKRSGGALPGVAGGTAQRGVVAPFAQDPLQTLMDATGEAGARVWRAAYADAVARMDADIGRVLDAVEARGRPTVLAIVADHGESLDDHGELLHGDAYWDSVTRVPLVIQIPGVAAGATDALVSHVDLAPTLLAAVGARPPAESDGVSLLPLITGAVTAARETTLVEGGVAWRADPIPRGAVITSRWALLRQDRGCGPGGREPPRAPGSPATCLYDLDADPQQTTNVSVAHPDVVEELVRRWDAFRAARAREGATLNLDPAYVEELRRTGYDFRSGP